jgi:hypothetical protein
MSMTIGSNLGSRLFTLTTFVALVAVAPAYADTCKKVDLAVKNGKSTTIKALSIEYKFSNDNQWHTESFPNVEVGPGAFKTVAFDQNLDGGEGNKLVGLKLHFQAKCGGKWSKTFVSAEDVTFDDTSPCASNSNRSYRQDLSSSDVCNEK